ncbi:hypothetical protein AOLI_G00209450 [Acnodon oligacanthus]
MSLLLEMMMNMPARNIRKHFSPEEMESGMLQDCSLGKMTDTEMNEREDLIYSTSPSRRRIGSLDIAYIPSMSGKKIPNMDFKQTDIISENGKKASSGQTEQRS